MCLAVPGKVIKVSGDRGIASLHGNEVPISTVLTPDVKSGDWVLVHAGFAIQQLDEAAAAETWKILADMHRAIDAADAESVARVDFAAKEAGHAAR
ncbi:MAG: HypC/HybG/HupF family hydrogenase formation chaperone [Tepidisphaeraceae bacterium]